MRVRLGHQVRMRGNTIWGAVVDFDPSKERPYKVHYPWGGFHWYKASELTDDALTPEVEQEEEQEAQEEAARTAGAALVAGERNEAYGPPRASFTRIAGLWSSYLGHTVTPADVASMMILLKVSREKSRHHEDNLADIEGYVQCARIIAEEES